MKIDYPMSPEPRTSRNHEPLPLLPDEFRRRPYQAYCVTETSSRPPSPDILISQPLRIRPSLVEERNSESLSMPDSFLSRSLTTRFQEDSTLATSPKLENASNELQEVPNADFSSRNMELGNVHHITQAVTPRGSHPLAGNKIQMCNRTPSQSRMQQSVPSCVATSRAYQWKPLPQSANNAELEPHPLPPLPVGAIVHLNCDDFDARPDDIVAIDGFKRIPQEIKSSGRSCRRDDSARRFPDAECGDKNQHLPLKVTIDFRNYSLSSRKSVSFQDEFLPGILQVHSGVLFLHTCNGDNVNLRDQIQHAQLPSSTELYVPRGIIQEMNDDLRAHRRTQPKDAKLKCEFGRRPTIKLDLPAPTPSHRHSPQLSSQLRSYYSDGHGFAGHDIATLPPSLSVHSFTDTQAGPRPPPWISYDDLEIQRRNRSEIREREDAHKYRMTLDTTSSSLLRKRSGSPNGFGESPLRREVEEYREQVLALYPDLAFDGTAGMGEREWRYCCVVM